MSKFSQEEQANIVGMAAELEAAIITEQEELFSLKAEKLTLPEGPKMEAVKEPKYVKEVIPKNKRELFSEWASENAGFFKFIFKHKYLPRILIISSSILMGLCYLFISFISMTDSDNKLAFIVIGVLVMLIFAAILFLELGLNNYWQKKYFGSDVWKLAISRETEAVNKKIYDEYMVRYNKAANEYNRAANKYNSDLPELQRKITVWQKSHAAKIAVVEKDLNENVDALKILYTSTQLIPSSYRTIERLTWLYEDMSTSEHDIERSIDLLNSKEIKEELINIQVHVDDMRRDIREGFVGIYAAIQDGNAIQSEMLTNLDGIRRSARMGNFMNVGNLIQNHNRNKTLSQINNKL